jgi:hypothetical protein
MAGWVRGLTACFLSIRGNRIAGMRAGRSDQDRDVALRRHTSSRALLGGYKALLADVNGLQRAAGLRDALGSLDEEILEATAKIK